MRLNYFLGETFIFRTYYRYFFDDWGIKAHTAQLEIPIKISPFVSLSPFTDIIIRPAMIILNLMDNTILAKNIILQTMIYLVLIAKTLG